MQEMKWLYLCALCVAVFGQLPGGWQKADPYSKQVQEIAWKSVKIVNERHANSEVYLVPAEVKQAESQIVAGINYKLTVAYGFSDCKKANMAPSDVTQENCPPSNCLERVTHRLLAYLKPWEHFMDIKIID